MPQLVEKLINYIEMHGLYTEGIYRKSGSTNKIKELRQGLDTGETDADPEAVSHLFLICVALKLLFTLFLSFKAPVMKQHKLI